jgi:hypothetical protein
MFLEVGAGKALAVFEAVRSAAAAKTKKDAAFERTHLEELVCTLDRAQRSWIYKVSTYSGVNQVLSGHRTSE